MRKWFILFAVAGLCLNSSLMFAQIPSHPLIDQDSGHGGFHINPKNCNAVLDVFDKLKAN